MERAKKFEYTYPRAEALAKALAENPVSKEEARGILLREGLITEDGRLVALIKEQPKAKSA